MGKASRRKQQRRLEQQQRVIAYDLASGPSQTRGALVSRLCDDIGKMRADIQAIYSAPRRDDSTFLCGVSSRAAADFVHAVNQHLPQPIDLHSCQPTEP